MIKHGKKLCVTYVVISSIIDIRHLVRPRVTENRQTANTRPKVRVIQTVFLSSLIAFYPIRFNKSRAVAELSGNSFFRFEFKDNLNQFIMYIVTVILLC